MARALSIAYTNLPGLFIIVNTSLVLLHLLEILIRRNQLDIHINYPNRETKIVIPDPIEIARLR